MADTGTWGVRYQFHPVGQGLFASGALGNSPYGWMGTQKGDIHFLWVYDCGTASSPKLVENAIGRLAERCAATKELLDLVVLSHFDKDHISGVVDLLGKLEVDVLLLPYVPLAQRIVLAFEEGIAIDDPLFMFFVDPVGYLNGADVRGIRRIVFVPPSEGEGSAPPEAGDDSPDRPEPDRHQDGDTYRREDEDAYRLVFRARPWAGDGEMRVTGNAWMLDRNSALRAGRVWEFVPYNDQTLAIKPKNAWLEKVHDLSVQLLREEQTENRKKVLADIKDLYDAAFGGSSPARNQISLFLYGGPIGIPAPAGCRGNYQWAFRDDTTFRHAGEWSHADRPGQRAAVLYTGDGYLDSAARIDALVQFLGNARIDRTAVFQVMHHGARNNWMPGVAARIGPWFSVFSSEPTRQHRHPHAEVLRDFWLHGPVQVSGGFGAQVHVWWPSP